MTSALTSIAGQCVAKKTGDEAGTTFRIGYIFAAGERRGFGTSCPRIR